MQAFARWGLWLIQALRESNDSLRSSAKVVTGDQKTFCSRESEKSTWAGLSNLGSLQTLLQQPRWDFFRSIGSDSWQKVSSVLQPSTIHNKFFYRSKPIFRNVSSQYQRRYLDRAVWNTIREVNDCNSIYSSLSPNCFLRLSQLHNRTITHLRDSEHYRFLHGQVQWTETESWMTKSVRCPQVHFCICSPILWVGGWESTLNFGPRSTKLVGNIRVTKKLSTLTIETVLTGIMESLFLHFA